MNVLNEILANFPQSHSPVDFVKYRITYIYNKKVVSSYKITKID